MLFHARILSQGQSSLIAICAAACGGMEIKMQKIVNGVSSYSEIGDIIRGLGAKKFMLVCGGSLSRLEVGKYLLGLDIEHIVFSDFSPNPKYEDIVPAVELYKREGCDVIVAAGGGSAIDVAKCIKLYAPLDPSINFLMQEAKTSDIPLVAIPTTAGTGSESTRYSVIYYQGEKQSVHHTSIVPDVAILLPEVLESLPSYQKKCTVLDALCQAIESYWAVKSNDESRDLADRAIRLIWANIEEYLLSPNPAIEVLGNIMLGSCLAGQAINITATTAPHAMSYKLTTTYGIPHGHSVGVGLLYVWKYMLSHGEKCTDSRGYDYLLDIFGKIASAMGYDSVEKAVDAYEALLNKIEISGPAPLSDRAQEIEMLAGAVNVERLGNNPVALDVEALAQLYGEILQ